MSKDFQCYTKYIFRAILWQFRYNKLKRKIAKIDENYSIGKCFNLPFVIELYYKDQVIANNRQFVVVSSRHQKVIDIFNRHSNKLFGKEWTLEESGVIPRLQSSQTSIDYSIFENDIFYCMECEKEEQRTRKEKRTHKKPKEAKHV